MAYLGHHCQGFLMNLHIFFEELQTHLHRHYSPRKTCHPKVKDYIDFLKTFMYQINKTPKN